MDGALRRWERALAGGDEQARVPLASAYQRLGRIEDALEVLSGVRGADPSANALRQDTWRSVLSRLAPARRIEGARAYGELWGWAGAQAVLLSSLVERRHTGLLGVVDWVRGDFVYEAPATRPPPPIPIASQPGLLLLPGGPGLLERLPLDGGPRAAQRLAAGGRVLELDPSLGRALLRYFEPGRRTVLGVIELAGGSELFHATGSADLRACVNWSAGWIAWSERGPLSWAELAQDAPPQPWPTAPGAPQPLAALDRFLLARDGQRLLLLDPRSGARHFLESQLPGARGRAHGPWRLSSDERHLLGYRLGLPLAIPLGGGLPRELSLPFGPALSRAAWHPQADLVACGRRGEGAELRALEGEVWLRLPRDAQALGWSPDGRSLVVLRQLGSMGGLLELWTPEGIPPSA